MWERRHTRPDNGDEVCNRSVTTSRATQFKEAGHAQTRTYAFDGSGEAQSMNGV